MPDPAIESKSPALEGSLPHCRWMFLLTEPLGRPICASVSLIKLMQKINTAACLLLPSSHPSLRGFSCTPKVRLGAPPGSHGSSPTSITTRLVLLLWVFPGGGPSQSELLIHPWCPLQGWKERTLKSKDEGLPGGTSGKEPTCQCRRHKRCGFDPWVGKIPWRRT